MAADWTGTAFDDTQNGSAADEVFDFSQGGHDTLNGNGGDDRFEFGAAFDRRDEVDGGAGFDTLVVDGDTVMKLLPTTFTNIEDLQLLGTDSIYHLVLTDENVGTGLIVELNGPADIDARAATTGGLDFRVHADAQVILLGGGGDDRFLLEAGLWRSSLQNGGGGDDSLIIASAVSGFRAADHTFRNIETINIRAAADIMFSDGNVAAGQTMSVVYDGKGGDQVQIDAHKELDGHYYIEGGDSDDVLTGGHLQDSLVGGTGDDTLTGGQGRDHLHGGGGHDIYVYRFVAESTVHAADVITGLGNDFIDLSAIDADTRTDGHQQFTLVDRFDGEAGELTLRYDAGRNVTRIMGDVNGDGHADLVINVVGDHTDFTGFIFSF